MTAIVDLFIGQPWMDDAVCVETDPDAFFPEKGGNPREAKQICNGSKKNAACPVRDQCLEWALANDERFGIFGGKSERERRELKRERPATPRKPPPAHGTEARAMWDRRRQITPCQSCRDAERIAHKARVAVRKPTVELTEKTCPACGDTKPADQFARQAGRPGGLSHSCKACKAEKFQQWYRDKGRAQRGRARRREVA